MIRFYNGRTVRFYPEIRLTDEEVWVDGGTISYVGPAVSDLPRFDREINLNGDILLPGFKNAHTHTPMTFLRSMADDMELHSWLSELVWPKEAKLTAEAVYYLAKLGILEYLTSGITASFDMYYQSDAYVKANVDSGFRTVLCGAVNDFDKDPTQLERDFLRFNSCGSSLISYILGMHAEYTTCRERVEYIVSLAEKYKAPCFTHLCETRSEVESCLERYGVTPPQFLESIGFFRYGGGGFHCCYMSDEDLDLFRDRGLWAVTCPASNLKLASGIAPISRMQKLGINIAIGTDSSSSNNALDMFREMFLVTALQKYIEDDASAMPAGEVLKMACSNGARAVGLSDCDDIAQGKKADLTVIDMSRPNMQPENHLINNIVYSGSKNNIRLTMVNGRILYEGGNFYLDESADSIYRKCNDFVRSIS